MMILLDRKTRLIFLSLFLSPVLFAQSSDRQVTRCGAVSRSAPVRNIFVDSDNTKWVASGSGVYKVQASDLSTPFELGAGEQTPFMFYSGNADARWTPEVLQMVLNTSPKITAAFYDSANDRLFLGTEADGVYLLGTKPALKLVAKITSENTKLQSNTVNTIFKDKSGRYWIGTDQGLLVGTPDKWKTELDGYDVQRIREVGADIYALADGEFWLAQNGQRWQAINIKEKALEGEAQDFDLDTEGNLWILSRMISRYNLLTDEFEFFSGAEYYTSEYGRCMAVDQDGAVWVGTDDKGLYLVDKASSLLVNCTVDQEVSCTGNGQDAVLHVKVSGGKPPYTYTWSAPQLKGDSPGGVGQGTYTVTVTDTAGKSKSGKVTVEDKRMTITVEQKKIESGLGAKDGVAEVKIKGGTPDFKFQWDNGESVNPAVKLSEGTRLVTVTDKRGCTATAYVNIGRKLDVLGALIEETTPIPCSGGNTILKVTVSGGKEPYQYEWSNPKFSGTQPTGVSAGTYTLTVVDAVGGKTVTSITVAQPSALSVVASAQQAAGVGAADGKALAAPRGGTVPYQFAWDNSETTETATRLTTGQHSVTVTDANGCTITTKVIIGENILPLAAQIEETGQIACNGEKSSLKVNVSGGKNPFEFQWSAAGLSGFQPEDVPAGVYSVTVTDVTGAKTTATFTIKQPEPLAASTTLDAAAAIASADGRASVKTTGGTSPYQIRWDTEETTERAKRLAPGTHTVTVSDANGCSTTATVEVTENVLPLSVRIEETGKITCAGGTTSLKVDVRGGKPPFQFVWAQPGLQGQQPTNVVAGIYQLVVVDAGGGRTSTAFQVLEPEPVRASATAQKAAKPGENDGGAKAVVSGGTPPYQIRWANDEVGDAAVRLGSGTFKFTVTDANGCTAVSEVAISEAILPLSANITELAPIPCNGQKATLRVHTSGGKRPYKFKWNTDLTGDQPEGVGVGVHIVSVTDAAGVVASAMIEIKEPPAILPFAILVSPASTGNSDGKAKAEGRGGTGKLSFLWDNGETTGNATKLSPGKHTVSITDERGCVVTFSLDVPENILPLTVNVEETATILCADQKSGLKVAVNGGKPPYQYKWDNPAWQGSEISNVSGGTYALLVTDAAGTTQSAAIIVKAPEPLAVEITRVVGATTERSTDGKATVKIKGGTPPNTIAWDNGETEATASKLKLGTHSVTVTDVHGCSVVRPVEIKQRILPELNASLLRSGQTIKMEQLRFEADSASLTTDALPTLDELYDFMEENGNIVIEIGGHTNSTPPDEFCDRLSTARAKSAAEYLISKGIDSKRVSYKGYGKRTPIATNATPEGRRLNQRVEIKILALKRE
ncbi:MAG: OmpA family protein [Saprospiraceae bacterium]|jgi:outer membrane protein OmpA-like peptidoglycan-associated protein|nr:OmpA family protein [Saprospiraceae bacterium]